MKAWRDPDTVTKELPNIGPKSGNMLKQKQNVDAD